MHGFSCSQHLLCKGLPFCFHRLVDALRFALTACRAEAIDVRLVHYKGVKGDFSQLEAEFATKPRGGGKKNK